MKHFLYFVCVLLLLSSKETFSQEIEWQRLHGIKGSYITAITQTQSGSIFVATPYGVWRSADTLKSWQCISKNLKDSLVYGLATTGDNALLVSTYNGVYKTTDNGAKWINVTPSNNVKKWQYIYANINGVCFAGANRRLYQSTDNGKVWTAIADTVFSLLNIQNQVGVATIGQDGRIFFRNYYSDDGKRWRLSNSYKYSVDYNFSVGTITTDGLGTIIGGMQFFSSEGEIIISRDNGLNYQHHSFTIEPQNISGSVFLRSKYDLLYKEVLHNYALILKDSVILTFFGRGVFKSPLNKNRPYLTPKDVTYNGINTQYATCLYQLKDGTVLLGSYGNGLYKSTDNGTQWSSVKLPFNYPIISKIINDEPRKTLYISTMNGLYSSKDFGKNWIREDTGFFRPFVTNVFCMDDGTLFATNHDRTYRRKLNERTWTLMSLPDLGTITSIVKVNDSILLFNERGRYKAGKYGEPPYDKTSLAKGFGWIDVSYIQQDKVFVGSSIIENMYSEDNFKTQSPSYRFEKEWTDYEGLHNYNTPTVCVRSSPYSSRAYFGTRSGIFALDCKDKYYTPQFVTDWLDKKFIYDITVNQKQDVYVASGGLFNLPFNKSKWEQISTPSQISNTSFMCAGTDSYGYLYVASVNGGLYRTVLPTVALEAPECKYPINNAKELSNKEITLAWLQSKNGTHYHVQVSESPDFIKKVYEDSTVKTLSTFTPALKVNSQYYWRVQSRLYRITSPWSETRSFNTITVYPSVVLLREPAKGSQNRNTALNLIWNLSTQTESYHIQVSEENTFGNTLINDSTLTSIEKKVENLEGGTEYFWRVRGKNKAGYGTWSDVWSFRTKGGINSIADKEENRIQCYLTNNEIVINNNPYLQETTQITLSDITGRIVLYGTLTQGTESTRIEIPTITSGYYTLSITNPHIKIHKGIVFFR